MVLSCFVAVCATVRISATEPPDDIQSLAVPAEFVKYLTLPGTADSFLRPAAIQVDRNFDEVLVADPGHNRIIIFDREGSYRYEFDAADHFSSPTDVVVDSQGFIYVLGTTRLGKRVFRFDFDGLFLGEVPTPSHIDNQEVDFRSIAVDTDDRLWALDHAGLRAIAFDQSGTLLASFRVIEGLGSKLERELVLGSLSIWNDQLFVPAASLGMVFVYALDGTALDIIGHKGNNVGELNFPVAVAVTDDELVMVLDKHRFNIVCFDHSGRFLGEFGGKGISPGWFYHPSLLAVDDQNRVYIGQIFKNRVQICKIPDFIVAGNLRGQLPRS